VEAEHHRVGHGDDLHHTGVGETLHALADGGLGQADGLADGGVGTPAVLLQLLDDPFGNLVESDPRAAAAPVPAGPSNRSNRS
jgi:hypothetical protein